MTRSVRVALALLAAAAVVFSSTPAGSPRAATPPRPQQQPSFRSITDLVQIDAVVVDEEGRHVRGLTAADFVLRDRGRPQTIATFEEVDHPRVSPADVERRAATRPAAVDVASNQTADDDRLVVMLIDDLHLFRRRTDRARTIARDVVARLGPGAAMAVIFTSGDRSTEITSDRRALTDAIDRLNGRRPFPRPPFATTPRAALTGLQGDGSLQNYYEHLSTIRAMRDASRLLRGGNTRRKAFVLISEWMPKDLSGLFQATAPPQTVAGGEAYAAGNLEAFDKPPDMGGLDYELIDMMDAMRRANVVTYALDPRGEVTSRELMSECHPSPPDGDPCLGGATGAGPPDWSSWVRQSQHGLEIATAASGGFAITNSDDFAAGLERIVDDLDHYYLLGFYPAEPERRGYRPIALTVNRPGLTIRHRQGYEAGAARETRVASESDDPLLALAAGVMPKAALPLRLTAMPMPGRGVDPPGRPVPATGTTTGMTTRVDVVLEVSAPIEAIAKPDGTVADAVRYTIAAVSLRDGKVARQFTNTARVSSPAPVAARPGAFVSYHLPVQLSLPPGRYQIRAAVLSEALGDGGSVYQSIDVPNFAREPLAMSALVLGYADGSRLPVTTGAGAALALPFTPTLSREFDATDRLRLYAEIASASRPVARVTVDLVDAAGRTVRELDPALAPDARVTVDLIVPLTGLAAGEYTLRVTAIAAGRASREIGFVVR